MEDIIMAVCTTPNTAVAMDIAREIVGRQLAACVNILPGVHSIYRWQDNVEEAAEVTMLIKTRQACYEALQSAIVEMHPYDVPEVIALPVTVGLSSYLTWIAEATS